MKWAHREGVLQVATGKKHQEEAICCVQRIRPYLNNKPVTGDRQPGEYTIRSV